MSPPYKTNDFVKTMARKGFDLVQRRGSGHLGLYLLDEDGRRTGVSSGVSLGGHAREIPYWYAKKIARELHITPKDLDDVEECSKGHTWILRSLRERGIIPSRAT